MLYKKLYFLFLLLPAILNAQEQYLFQHLTVEDGLLSDPKVNAFQDAKGFYWFSGVNGIQRYDGVDFINYKYNYKASNTVSGDFTGKPIEDKNKNIWIVNEQGINIFLRIQQRLERLYMPDAIDSNANNVASVIKDDKDIMWIITSRNIFRYDYATKKSILFYHLISEETGGIAKALYDASDQSLWLYRAGKKNEIGVFDFSKKQLIYPIQKTIDNLLGHNNPVAFFQLDNDKDLWMANYLGDFCKYNIISGSITNYSILHDIQKANTGAPNSTINDCIDDGNGSVWFGGDYYLGLLCYNKKSGNFSRIKKDNGSEYGLHYNEIIYNFFKDKDEKIWVNTDLGMNIFDPGKEQFKYLIPKTDASLSAFSTDVSSIFQSKSGDIWISTWGDGIFRYDSSFSLLKNYVHDESNQKSLGERLNRTWCFSEDNKGKIWVGCQYGMLGILDTASGKFINENITAFAKKTIMYMTKDKKGNIWFGLFNGNLAKWDVDSNKLTNYTNVYGNGFKDFLVMHGLYEDNADNLWISTSSHGLNKFSTEKNEITETDFFPQNIFSVCSLNDSVLIGGTSGKGLFLFNKFTRATKYFTTADGLSSDFIFGAIPAKNNSIWVFANNGIQKLNLITRKISKYDVNDGIKDHVFEGPFYQLRNGIIMVAAHSGVIYFNPGNMKTKAPADVMITDFRIAQKSVSVDSLSQNENIALPYSQNSVTIGYAAVSFSTKKTDHYFYQLKGVDKDWVSADTRRSVTYANLSPGKYIFKVKSQNADGIDSAHIAELAIIVNAPWWQTWWAILSWVSIGAIILYTIYAYRKSNRNELARMRQKIASDLHDDIGSTLNSISVYSEIATQQFEMNPANSKSLLAKMGDASRNMIDNMNDIVWAINPKNDQFENILQRMQYFAGELLSGKNIPFKFEVEEKIKTIKLPMEKRKNFYLIFKEAITNAYKYAGNSLVKVSLISKGNFLVMIIADKGTGFNTTTKTLGGNGIKNMQARAKEIHAQLNIVSNQNEGTTIELKLPVK